LHHQWNPNIGHVHFGAVKVSRRNSYYREALSIKRE